MKLTPPDRNSNKPPLICGIVATFIVGILIDILAQRGMDRDIASILVLVPIITILVVVFPESLSVGKMTIMWAIVGIVTGVAFFMAKYGRTAVSLQSSTGMEAYVYYIVTVAILQPFFEEIVVRRFLFIGIANLAGPTISALIVSILFALVHCDIYAFAGVFSFVMCWMAWCGVSTFNRAVLHGCYNLTIAIIMIIGGVPRVI